MAWSIVEVARMSGVSSRTLRHYHAIGLLPPAHTGANGYRFYERDQLLRLQQIMLLRELGVGLAAIAEVVHGGADVASALRRHRERLLEERDRVDLLVRTVEKTLAEMEEGGERMRPEELFEGFDREKQARYEAELVERYGDGVREHIETSWQRVGSMTTADATAVSAGFVGVEERLTALLVDGAATDDQRVLDVLDEHYAIVERFWTPNAEQYAGLGDLYVDSPDFKARYDARDPRLAEFMRDAMAAYALARLS